jgi:hypothetical protein
MATSNSDIFPVKLHKLLGESRHAEIISWLPDGRSFKIYNKERFAREIMPKYFGSSTYKSFQRSKNLWG